jgi:aspartyl-tRNA synthetase
VLHGVFEEFANGRKVSPAPFPRIPYSEAMLRYGVDKPDLRNPIVIADVKPLFDREDVSFKAFKNKEAVRAIPAPGAGAQPRSWFDRQNDWARSEGAAGLGYIVFEEEAGKIVGKGPIAKFLPQDVIDHLVTITASKAGDAVFFTADKAARAAALAGQVRIRLGNDLDLIKKDRFEFCWVVDFPMFEWNEDEKKIDFSHNPFSMPQGGLEALETKDPLTINAYQYDIVCNGVELSSGAIRNHKPETMLKAFEIAGYSREETEARFGGMLNAFRFGAPPHGGSAPGIDRIVMLLAEATNLRDVTMFPMNQQAQDLLMGAPSEVLPKQLRELHIRVVPPEKP